MRGTRTLPLHDSEQLGALLSELRPRLTALAIRMTRDPDAAQDVVQSAFEKVLRHGHRFRGGSQVGTWVHRIVANESLMWLRAQRRRGRLQGTPVETQVVDPAPGPAEDLIDRDRDHHLRAGIARLPGDERDVLVRCALANESYRDYAARTGVHPAAVKSRAFRARRRLGEILQEGLGPGEFQG